MTVWVVDDGPLGFLAQEMDPSWAWPAATLSVLEAVANGGSKDKSGRRTQLLAMKAEGSPVIVQRAIEVGTKAETFLYEHLRPSESAATADLGEHESIAWMLHDATSDTVFVTCDKGAAYLALCELGPGRVASAFDLWLDLRERSLITRTQHDALCQRVAKAFNLQVPWRSQSD